MAVNGYFNELREYLRLIKDQIFGTSQFRKDMELLCQVQKENSDRLNHLMTQIAAMHDGLFEDEPLAPGPPLGGRWPE